MNDKLTDNRHCRDCMHAYKIETAINTYQCRFILHVVPVIMPDGQPGLTPVYPPCPDAPCSQWEPIEH